MLQNPYLSEFTIHEFVEMSDTRTVPEGLIPGTSSEVTASGKTQCQAEITLALQRQLGVEIRLVRLIARPSLDADNTAITCCFCGRISFEATHARSCGNVARRVDQRTSTQQTSAFAGIKHPKPGQKRAVQ